MIDYQQALEALEGELQANSSSPKPETISFLDDALKRLRSIPFSVDPKRRVNCLIDIAAQFYHQGENALGGVEPAALAVILAIDSGDDALIRRALTVQAVILIATNNPGDATALAKSLEIAERIGDEIGKGAVWINLGTAFYEVALYADARNCGERANQVATETPSLRAVKAVALANVALYCMHMRDYEGGRGPPWNPLTRYLQAPHSVSACGARQR